MTGRTLNMYHVTAYDTAVRILDSKGIDPAFSQGKTKVAWFVTKQMVPWAIAHVAHRHHLTIDEIAILHVKTDTSMVLRTSRRSVYCTTRILRPLQMDSAAVWLSRQEQKVLLKRQVLRGNGWRGPRTEEEDELS